MSQDGVIHTPYCVCPPLAYAESWMFRVQLISISKMRHCISDRYFENQFRSRKVEVEYVLFKLQILFTEESNVSLLRLEQFDRSILLASAGVRKHSKDFHLCMH